MQPEEENDHNNIMKNGVVGGRGHCRQQAPRVRDGCFVVKTYKCVPVQ